MNGSSLCGTLCALLLHFEVFGCLKQEALAKSLPGVPAASLQLFFRQVSSGIPQPLPPHAAGHAQHMPPAAAAEQYLHYQDQQQQLPQQRYDDAEPGWRDAGDGFGDHGSYADCRQHSPPPQWPPPERYQV